jgi:uncharacterized protein with HEPN domain
MSAEPKRDWRLFADDILESCGRIRRAVAGESLESFRRDELRCDAVARNIEVIGEAAKHLPEEVVARAPTIPWRNIRGMRDVLAHGYFGVSTEVLWTTATTRIDQLEAAVRHLLELPGG